MRRVVMGQDENSMPVELPLRKSSQIGNPVIPTDDPDNDPFDQRRRHSFAIRYGRCPGDLFAKAQISKIQVDPQVILDEIGATVPKRGKKK